MKSTFLTLIILFFFGISCQNPRQEDFSYTIDEYMEMGFPDMNKTWEYSDFSLLHDRLLKIKYEHPKSLPRMNSKKSGALFHRLINDIQLAFLDDDSLSFQEQTLYIREYGDYVEDLIHIYEDFIRREQYYNTELIQLYILNISVGEEMMNLAKKILSSDRKQDHAWVHSLEAIQFVYLNKLYPVMEKQAKRSLYKKKEYRILCDSVGAHLNRNMEWFDAETASRIGEQLQNVSDSVDIPAVRREYQNILEHLSEK